MRTSQTSALIWAKEEEQNKQTKQKKQQKTKQKLQFWCNNTSNTATLDS